MNKCKYTKQCGGCDYQGMSYEKQLAKKQKYIEGLLAPVLLKNGYEKEEVSKKFLPILGANNPYCYRNKVHAVFGMGRNKKTICGIYEKNSHWVVDIDTCQIEEEKAVEIIRGIKDMMPSFRMRPFDEDKKTGMLRHVLIRVGEHVIGDVLQKEYLVILVTGTKEFPGKKNFVKALVEKYPEITTIVWNINDKKTSMVLGEREEVLYGKGYVTDTLLNLNFQISPKSFYQVNKRQTEVLYQCAGDMANLSESDVVLDAYCGTGTIGSTLANRVKAVVGVELNKDAVADAKRNAKENDLQNIHFICKDAGEYLEGLAQKRSELSNDEIPTVVVMDPPRSGSSKAFLNSLLKLKPERVVYISCGPESLKRDLEYLLRPKHGKRLYRVEKVQPVDMFPMTKHVESIALLQRMSNTQSKEITLDVEMQEKDKEEDSMELRKINTQDAFAQWEYTTALPTDENGLTNPYNGVSYDEYVEKVLPELISYEHPVNMPEWFVPETYYYLWDDGCLVGEFRIRHHLTEALRTGAGHIGYSVLKGVRGKGYGTEGLRLTVMIAKDIIPEDEIYLRVNKDNIASQKVMKKNGARIAGEDETHLFMRIAK